MVFVYKDYYVVFGITETEALMTRQWWVRNGCRK